MQLCNDDDGDVDKPARLIIRLLFGFGSDSVFVKLKKMKTNTETAIMFNYVI